MKDIKELWSSESGPEREERAPRSPDGGQSAGAERSAQAKAAGRIGAAAAAAAAAAGRIDTAAARIRAVEPQAAPDQDSGRRRASPASRASWARRLVVLVVLALTAGGGVILGRWALFRRDHLVTSDARVKGLVSKVGARLDGQVVEVTVEQGESVSRGKVLARLEDHHLRAAVDRARFDAQRALEALETERLAIDQDRHRLTAREAQANAEVAEAEAELRGARSVLERSDKEHGRVKSLRSEDLVSQNDLDVTTATVKNSEASVSRTKASLEAARQAKRVSAIDLQGLAVREQQLKVLQSQVDVARSSLALAEADLAATTIMAPADGWVVEVPAPPGTSVKVGQPIISLWLSDSVWVEAWFDERQLGRVEVGSQATVRIEAYPDALLTGYVRAVGALTDSELQGAPVPATLGAVLRGGAKVPIRIALENADRKLQPGLTAVVAIPKSSDSTLAGRRHVDSVAKTHGAGGESPVTHEVEKR